MTDFSILRSRLTGTLTTPEGTDHTAGVDSTIRHRPDASYARPLRPTSSRPYGSPAPKADSQALSQFWRSQ